MVVQRLKTIAHVIAGQSPSSDDVKPLDEGIPFIQGNAEFGNLHPTPKWECNSATKFAEPGDILISVRAPVGEVNIADSKIGIGRGLAAIRPKDVSLSKWLYFALQSNKEYLNSIATGSTFTAVNTNDIGNIRLTVPEKPKDIADQLDRELAEIDDFINEQYKLLELLDEKFQAQLEEIFRNNYDSWTPLKRLGVTKKSGFSAIGAERPANINTEIGVLKTASVTKGEFLPSENKLVQDPTEVMKLRNFVEKDSLIVNRANTKNLVGSIGYSDTRLENIYLSDLLWSISVKNINPKVIYYYSKTQSYRNQISQIHTGTSASMQKISYENFKNIQIPIFKANSNPDLLNKIERENKNIIDLKFDCNQLISLLIDIKNILIQKYT